MESSFAKVKLENGGRGGAPMARLNDVSSIDKIFSDRAASNETSLVRVNEERNEAAKSKGETFGMDLEATVLKRDGAEIVRSIGANLLGECYHNAAPIFSRSFSNLKDRVHTIK
jgi:hypothetical protein